MRTELAADEIGRKLTAKLDKSNVKAQELPLVLLHRNLIS